jgi:type I restriction enzyme M protein
MAIKKSEIYSTLWRGADELRGGMDASQYKDYVLTLLFLKYVSDKYANDPHALIEVPEGTRYEDLVALKGDKEIGDKINKAITRLAEANGLEGVIDIADFNAEDKLGKGKEMVDRLSRLVAIFEGLDLGRNRAGGDDLLGDAYEYLMRHFATESGKSKGQFYTPAEVSRILAKVLGIGPNTRQDQSAYDPTSGSGSLLLKVHDEAPRGLSLFGQEMDHATHALARMNMILHDVPTAEIARGNTLSSPYFREADGSLKKFDFAVANPPFSQKNWTSGLSPEHDEFGRFELGIPPAKNGDYAFLLHILASLKSTGKAAVILPLGVLFRGNAEAGIRRNLVRRGYLKGIIGLPLNLFYGTGIPACILVLDKEHAATRRGVFMVDASRGFIKDGNKNRLREQDIHRIVDVFRRGVDVPRYARMVSFDEIADPKNDFNLNLPRYIDATEPEDLHDIDAHLRGGIPERDLDALAHYWAVLPGVRAALFESAGRPGYARLRLPIGDVRSAILAHPEFDALNRRIIALFEAWRAENTPLLTGFDREGQPKALIEVISEALLAAFRAAPLLDAYDIYQHLMNYWAETMQDDAYLISAEGWTKGAQPREIVRVRDRNNKLVWPEPHDYLIGKRRFKSDLVPALVLVDRYFAAERDAIVALDDEMAGREQQLDEMLEEHGGDEGLLNEVVEGEGDRQKITAKAVKDRLNEIGKDPSYDDEREVLRAYAALLDEQSRTRARRRQAQEELDAKIGAKYPALSEGEIRTLVVDDKWMAHLSAAVRGEMERVSQTLTGRIRDLAERYATPLPQLTDEVETLAARVEKHLARMGAAWK